MRESLNFPTTTSNEAAEVAGGVAGVARAAALSSSLAGPSRSGVVNRIATDAFNYLKAALVYDTAVSNPLIFTLKHSKRTRHISVTQS